MVFGKCLYVNFRTTGNFGGGKFNETVLAILKEIFCEVELSHWKCPVGEI